MALSRVVEVEEDGCKHIGFRDKEKNNIYSMFRTRSVLFQKACSHKTANGIDMMIKDIFLSLRDVHLVRVSADKKLTLKECLPRMNNEKLTGLRGFLCLSDSILNAVKNLPMTDQSQQQELSTCEQEELKEIKLENLKHYPEHFGIDKVKISYASEKPLNPIKDIYFFEKDQDFTEKLPVIKKNKPEVKISLLNTPKTLLEYRLRLYSKKAEDELHPEAKEWLRLYSKNAEDELDPEAKERLRQYSKKAEDELHPEEKERLSLYSKKAEDELHPEAKERLKEKIKKAIAEGKKKDEVKKKEDEAKEAKKKEDEAKEAKKKENEAKEAK